MDPQQVETDITEVVGVVDMLKQILESLGKLHAKLDNSGIVHEIEAGLEKVVRL